MRTLIAIVGIMLGLSSLTGCLLVVAGAAGETGYIMGQDGDAKTTMSDQLITTKIKTRLIADEIVKARNINVDTDDGVVTLRGIVFSAEQKARARVLAQETKGVKKVISHLQISP